jgi:hypothetical protein
LVHVLTPSHDLSNHLHHS